MSLRQRLLELIDRSGVSDYRLSMLATGSTDTVRNMRRGSTPRLDSLEALCLVLGFRLEMVPLDELRLNGGSVENAQAIAAHESPRTTKLYDRTAEVSPMTSTSDLPLPLKTVKGMKGPIATFPVSRDCMQLWLDSFNAWVDSWNKAESLGGLYPDWIDAHFVEPPYLPKPHRIFSINNQKHKVDLFFRVRGHLSMQHIEWACWKVDPHPMKPRSRVDRLLAEIRRNFHAPKPLQKDNSKEVDQEARRRAGRDRQGPG